MKIRHLLGVAVLCVTSAVAFAGGLSRHKGWDKTPQGYLMTTAERTEWANVKTDEDADKFIKDFLARRGPDFVDQVNLAASKADKYFSTDKTPGSLTERGRLVIMLGPPSAISVVDTPIRGAMRTPSGGALTNAHEGGGGELSAGGSTEDYMSAANNAHSGDTMLHTYSFTYDANRLPSKFGTTLTVSIGLEPSGKERIDHRTQVELDKVYELAAQSKLTAR
jgi:GWxTD domain-containing protein